MGVIFALADGYSVCRRLSLIQRESASLRNFVGQRWSVVERGSGRFTLVPAPSDQTGPMHELGYELLRILLPRGWVNRGAGLGRMGRLRATRLCVRGCGFGVPRQEFGAESIQLPRVNLADEVVLLEGILLQVVVLLWPIIDQTQFYVLVTVVVLTAILPTIGAQRLFTPPEAEGR
jgi:hypothetical protein